MRHDLVGEMPGLLCSRNHAQMAIGGELILLAARDIEFPRQILRGLSHHQIDDRDR